MAGLILVAGAPAAGKTTLARRLAADLKFPLLTKDTIKETLAEAFTVDSLELSRQAGLAATLVLYRLVGELRYRNIPVIAESAFHAGLAEPELAPLVSDGDAVLLHCRVPPQLRAERYAARRAERHAVHVEQQRAIQTEPGAGDRWAPMDLGIPTLLIDSSRGYDPDYRHILDFATRGGTGPASFSRPARSSP